MAGKLWHFDINDGYRLKHDVDIGVGLVNPFDWLAVLMLLRSHGYHGPFNLDYKPPRTTSNHGVFAVSFRTSRPTLSWAGPRRRPCAPRCGPCQEK